MKLSKAFRYSLLFAVVGTLITVLIIYVQRSILNTYEKNLPFIALGDHVNNRITAAHLNFEELISGDNAVTYQEQVLGQLTSCKDILKGAYDGRETELGKFYEQYDEETKALLKESMIDLDNLITSANTRWEIKQRALNNGDSTADISAASSLDTEFDERAAKFKITVDKLVNHVNAKINSETSQLNTMSWISIGVVLTAFSLLFVIIYRLQNENENTIAENAVKLVEESKRVTTLSQFIEAVSAGNYDINVKAGDETDNLTTMLENMRSKLKQNAEDDRKRNWTTTGLAQIGDILRATTSSSSELYDNIIRFVVKYTKSNQGGLFIINEENENDLFIDLVACYAFERKKYLQKKVGIGDGLIGQCYLEGERIYLLEVPQEYISITSGLGGANPNALLIVPMKVNDKIYGVIELATFNKFEEYEIELVEKLAESIASTISNVRINETTRVLLEKTQQQAEEMKSQEEEIRQNMEELEATQEEMRRKQTILEKELDQSQKQGEILRIQEKKLIESQDTLQAIVDNIPRAIFWKDKDLRFMGCNIIFANVAGASSPRDLTGKSDFDMAWSAQADAYRKDDLEVMRSRKSKLDIEEVNVNSDGTESWVRTSKVPIVNQTGEVVAILGMFEDITAYKLREADVARKLVERDEALQELEALKQLLQTKKV
jgi:PAS domain S-box-containing protein